MAVAIKVFTGTHSSGAGLVVYTCPVGLCAKIVVSALSSSTLSSSYPPFLYTTGASISGYPAIIGGQITTIQNVGSGLDAIAQSGPTYLFTGPGDSVSVGLSGLSGATISYNFAVIEEVQAP